MSNMSDPVTNVEIEDVLSSIRRLVSDEGRNAPALRTRKDDTADTGSAETEPKPAPAPALILTPALRVAGDEDLSKEEYSWSGATPDAFPVEPVDDQDRSVVTLSETARADAQAHEAGTQHEELATDDAGLDGARDEYDSSWADEFAENMQKQAEAPEHADHEPRVDGEIAGQPEAETADHADLNHDDTREETKDNAAQDAGQESEILPWEDAKPAPSDDVMDDVPPQTAVPEQEQQRSIEDKIAALEALIGPSESGFEPETADEANEAAMASVTRLPWHDAGQGPQSAPNTDPQLPDPDAESQSVEFDQASAAFKTAHDAATKQVADEMAAAAGDGFASLNDADGAAFLDEDALREMVADIVRQELQGPLGERITRNVRKLVRREIYRALAANELE